MVCSVSQVYAAKGRLVMTNPPPVVLFFGLLLLHGHSIIGYTCSSHACILPKWVPSVPNSQD